MTTCRLNQFKKLKEKFFKLKPKSKTVYKVNFYDKENKCFSCSDCDDLNSEKFFSSKKLVITGFTY